MAATKKTAKKIVKKKPTKRKSRSSRNLGVLSPQEKKFCTLYGSDQEFFCNGTQSYIEAFEVILYKGQKPEGAGNYMTYDSVRDAAHKLLTNTHICAEINAQFESRGLNDTFVDKQLEKLITQDAEMSVKIKAIAEYNKLKARIREQHDHKHSFAAYDERTDEDLQREIEEQRKFFTKQ